MTVIRRQLGSPAMIVACVALIVALSGVSYAAGVLPKNSIGTAQLQKKAVTGKKIAKNAVTGPKVANGTLMAADFKGGQLPAGPQGPKGDPGSQGSKGDKGDPGISGYETVEKVGQFLAPGAQSIAYAACPAGKKAIGGGVGSDAYLAISDSRPDDNGTTWKVGVRNVSGSGSSFSAFAICANVG